MLSLLLLVPGLLLFSALARAEQGAGEEVGMRAGTGNVEQDDPVWEECVGYKDDPQDCKNCIYTRDGGDNIIGVHCYECNEHLSMIIEEQDTPSQTEKCVDPKSLDGDATTVSIVMASVDLALVLAALGVCIWLTVKNRRSAKKN